MNELRPESLPPDVIVVVKLLADLLVRSRVAHMSPLPSSAPEPVNQKLLLRMEEAAELLSISRTKVYQLIYQGELPVVRIGRSVRVSTEDLRGWIHRHTDAPFIQDTR